MDKLRAIVTAILLGLLGATAGGAAAADLNAGNCCADIEERVAELEATVARKGNRKVSLAVYGQVNAGILYIDDGISDDVAVIQGAPETSRFGFKGEAVIGTGIVAGYKLEIEADDALDVRHSFVYVGGPAGRVSLGHTSTATDGAAETSVVNTDVAARMLSIAPLSQVIGADLPFDGGRADVIRFDSGSIAGFTASAAWAGEGSWDGAVRYAGEFGGFKLAAAGGYREDDLTRAVIASASILHVTTGVFANASFGRLDLGAGIDTEALHVQAGIERKFNPIGTTTIVGEWAEMSIDGVTVDPTLIGAAFVQRIDAAALDLYASWRRYDVLGDIDVMQAGARIQF